MLETDEHHDRRISLSVGPVGTVCAGCGRLPDDRDAPGWLFSDAAWCPECSWLA